MILSLAVIVIAAIIAYIWSARGFFSAFLHMLCVIAAGALAFAVWEPLAHWILSNDPTSSGVYVDLAWGLALALPFAILLTILRVACDKLVPFNLKFDGPVNLGGGLACGAVSGTIASGILLLSVSFMRLDTEFLGHQPVRYANGGALERQSSLWFPVDRLTAWFYKTMSNSTLCVPSGESLGRWHPELADEGWLLRVNFEEGKAKATLPPDAFEVLSRYSLTSTDSKSLFGDTNPPQRQVGFSYLDGEQASPAQSTVEGFVVKFNSGAKEQSGQIVVGPGQMSLIVQKDASDPYSTMSINPLAMISKATGDNPKLGRWRFDAPNVFISSPGGGADAMMAFEFAVPRGAMPIALNVKGVRHDLTTMPPGRTYSSVSARDAAIESGMIVDKSAGVKLNWSQAVKVKIDPGSLNEAAVKVNNSLPYNIILQKDTVKELTIVSEGADNRITGGGLAKFAKNEMSRVGDARSLQVRQFSVSDDVQIVHVVVDSKNPQFGFLSNVAADMSRDAAPLLVDHLGQTFPAWGYVYRGSAQTWVYFSPQAPLKSVVDQELPTLSRSQPDQELTLIFVVSRNVKLRGFAVGEKGLAEFVPPVEVK